MENKRVFVSPGMFTSEKDLTFVTNNIGVTTLGLVGETLKGPAFQPIFISNYAEMKNFFGGQNPEKIKDTGALRYELPYIAKSYLENANQLYVTRVLGLSGYTSSSTFGIMAGDVMVAALKLKGTYDANNLLTFNADSVTITATDVATDFTIEVSSGLDVIETHEVSLDRTKKNFITRKLGVNQVDAKFEIYVDEIYTNYIDGLVGTELLTLAVDAASEATNFKTEYKSAYTPYIVSEVIGATVNKLFRFETISDGNAANKDVKISITNIKPDDREFDVEVRAFNDTDSKPVILERFSKVNLDPTSKNYIGKRIGTVNGDFLPISSYALVEMVDGDNKDSYPAGFEGYTVRGNLAAAEMVYKSDYTEFENVRKKYLGISDDVDADTFKFKGVDATGKTKGFHMDFEAPATFVVGAQSFKNEAELTGTNYEKVSARKFTVAFAGGFDGWDIYRTNRTNSDKFTVQKFDNAGGLFDVLPLSDGDSGITSDYYAFLEAIRTFSNPEAVDINVFATPGIDLFNNPILSDYTIDMIETERGDCIYIATLPDMSEGSKMTSQDVSDRLANDFDSNYTATYWPWIQKADVENSVSVYLPPTCEVIKNIALTDNIAHPWFATAGYKFGKINAIKARTNMTQVNREIVYANRINPIATFAGDGTIIMGNKNLQVAETALNRLNVRRLLLRARKLVSQVGVKLLFDQNDGEVREEFLRQVNPILEKMRKDRGLANFAIELDPIGPEGADRNTMTGRIRIQPTNALEYIYIGFDVTQNGASFDDK